MLYDFQNTPIKPKVLLNLSKAALNYGVTDLSEASTADANTASYAFFIYRLLSIVMLTNL